MSDTTQADHNSAAADAPRAQTAGQMLRQLREQAGMDPLLMASSLKVTPQKLQALEEDRLDELPDLTFARALAAAEARALGLDPATVLALMPNLKAGLPGAKPINTSFYRAGDQPAPVISPGVSKTAMLVAGGLLVLAAVLWLLPGLPQLNTGADGATTTVAGTAGEGGVALEPLQAQLPAGAMLAEQGALPQAASAASAAAAASAPASAVSAPVEVGPGPNEVRLAATGDTWVSVRDATGNSLLNRAMTSGEIVVLNSDAMPLTINVGRKEAVRMTLRGEAFDLQPLSRTSAVRFQVN